MNRDKQTGFMISKESVEKVLPKNDVDILGYESPVKVIMGQMRMEQENNIFKAIQDYGVNVDKDELIKALQYDRDQYEKGYNNGYNRKASDVIDEFAERLKLTLVVNNEENYLFFDYDFTLETIDQIANKMKGVDNDWQIY